MTAIDFAAFVDKLATVSGETILPFFRTALTVEAKKRDDGAFDPVTAADRAAEAAMRVLIREASWSALKLLRKLSAWFSQKVGSLL